MSRKRNTRKGGKKARDYGSKMGSRGGGMRKHRGSGKSKVNKWQRAMLCAFINLDRKERAAMRKRRTKFVESVMALMRGGGK